MARLLIQCGIYQITNTTNKNIYIGSSNDLMRRKSQHFHCLKNNKHANPKLQASYNKNPTAFKFFIVEFCQESELLDREQQYLNILWDNGKICYNASKLANGEGTPQKEFNLVLVDPSGIEHLLISGLGEFARKHNLRKENLSALIHGKLKTHKGWYLKSTTFTRPESKTNICSFKSPDGTIYRNIKNITEFAERFNLVPSSLNKLLHGRRNSLFGWKLADDRTG